MTEAQTGVSPLADLVRAARLPEPAERKRIRLAASASFQRLADELDVEPSTVYRWEDGQLTPTLENAARYRALLEQLAEAAGTQIAEAS